MSRDDDRSLARLSKQERCTSWRHIGISGSRERLEHKASGRSNPRVTGLLSSRAWKQVKFGPKASTPHDQSSGDGHPGLDLQLNLDRGPVVIDFEQNALLPFDHHLLILGLKIAEGHVRRRRGLRNWFVVLITTRRWIISRIRCLVTPPAAAYWNLAFKSSVSLRVPPHTSIRPASSASESVEGFRS